MKKFINHSDYLEAISEIADLTVAVTFGESRFELSENGDCIYSDKAQDLFNQTQIQVEHLINTKLEVFSIEAS